MLRAEMMATLGNKPLKIRAALVVRNWNKWKGLFQGDKNCLHECKRVFNGLLQRWVNLDRDLVESIFRECGLLPHVTLAVTAGGVGSSLKCFTMKQPPLPPPLNLLALVEKAAGIFESLGPSQDSVKAIVIPQRLAVLSEYTGCHCLVKMSQYQLYAKRTAVHKQIETGALRNGDSSDNREHMHRRKPPPSGFRRHEFARKDIRGGESGKQPSKRQNRSE